MPPKPSASSRAAMILRAPGWYPDPTAAVAGDHRWWDGATWSGRTRLSNADGPTGIAPAPGIASAPGIAAVTEVPRALTLEQQLATARRDATWAPFGLALASLIGIALIPLFHVIGVAFLTLALAAVVLGVRAIGLRARGLAIPLAPPIIGVVVGAGSSLVLAGLLLLSVVARLL